MEETAQQTTKTTEAKGFFAKLINGDFGLATTYWIYGVIGSLATKFLFNTVGQSSATAFLTIYIVATVYFIAVWIGIWRASDKFVGDGGWIVAARIMVAISILLHLKGTYDLLQYLTT